MSESTVTATPVAVSNSVSTPDSSSPPPTITVNASTSHDVAPSGVTDPAPQTDTTPAVRGDVEAPKLAEDPRQVQRFKELSKRDKEMRTREQALKAREQQLTQLAEAEALAKSDPLAFMEKWGVTYEDLTGRILSRHDKDPQLSAVEQEIANLRKEREDEKVALQNAQIAQTISGFKQQIKQTIDSDTADAFELVRAEDAYDDVYDVIEGHFAQSGEIMPVERAAGLVEEYLLGEAKRIAKAKKVQALYAPAGDTVTNQGQSGATARPVPGVSGNAVASTPVTLTNGAVSAANPLPHSSNVSIEESKRRAAALLKFR